MALDLLMEAQGGTSIILHAECCVYIPDNSQEVTQALATLGNEIHISAWASGSFISWWNSWGRGWHHAVLSLFSLCFFLLLLRYSLYCIYGIWMQCANALTTQELPVWKN